MNNELLARAGKVTINLAPLLVIIGMAMATGDGIGFDGITEVLLADPDEGETSGESKA